MSSKTSWKRSTNDSDYDTHTHTHTPHAHTVRTLGNKFWSSLCVCILLGLWGAENRCLFRSQNGGREKEDLFQNLPFFSGVTSPKRKTEEEGTNSKRTQNTSRILQKRGIIAGRIWAICACKMQTHGQIPHWQIWNTIMWWFSCIKYHTNILI